MIINVKEEKLNRKYWIVNCKNLLIKLLVARLI